MMEKVKTYALISILLVCGCLLLYAHMLSVQNRRLTAKRPPLPTISNLQSASSIVDTYTDATGHQHAVITSPAARQRIRDEVGTVAKRIVDSLAPATGVKPKDISAFLNVAMQAVRDSVKFLSRTLDSQRRITRFFKDQYVTLAVHEPLPEDTVGKGSFDLAYNADLKFVDYSRHNKVLGLPIGRRQYYTDISSSDPRMKIKGVERFTFKRHVPAFGFRLQALTTYDVSGHYGVRAGIGMRFDFGDRFNSGINYTYSFLLKDWVPIVYAKYDLLQFGR